MRASPPIAILLTALCIESIAPATAAESDPVRALAVHSGTLMDHVISKYRARLRVSAALRACGKDALSDEVWIKPEAQFEELSTYVQAHSEAAHYMEEIMVAVSAGLHAYRSGVVDATRAFILARPQEKEEICHPFIDAAKLLEAP